MTPNDDNYLFEFLPIVIKYSYDGQIYEIEIKLCRFMMSYIESKIGLDDFLHYLAFLEQYPDGDLTKYRTPIERVSVYVEGLHIIEQDYADLFMRYPVRTLEIMAPKEKNLKQLKICYLDDQEDFMSQLKRVINSCP
jgi:hypothetical protein